MISYIKENFNFIIITLWFMLSIASGLYNYKHRDIYIQDMRDIVNLITQDVEEGVYKPTFRYIGFPYYNMSYQYYTPYDSQKAAILSNINGNDDFVLIGEYVYDNSTSKKYCYGIYDIGFSEMLDGSGISFYVIYSKQSDCYKKKS
ncbi:hypothetical protein B0181_07415 [Moraxella caviae]|uniref:Uncharacterized protein n=1 Tax=Moraxella caviae TaxID=34060 RepID=A0A1T0A0I7_9GAMM|nr:hypothetical protein [Moraxella caviae]OOR89177.1 hypothetical protein B0181_07415 [Moraxella caviae]STZ09697.1 Uncharacterised protein [Moraxella caviae]STZ10692.1 Uncharacterised protein [Moraxella caviae]STZ13545.1 Uncharacterised protein [Moraxella caviae]STZ13594.1 Uncharacterised protein [Moraxella caviae]